MQLGFVSAILPDMSFEEVLKTASDIGYDCVEIMCWPAGKAERRYAGITHISVEDFSDDDAARVRDAVDAAGVSISGLGYYPNPLTPDAQEAEAAVQHIRNVISACNTLGIPQMNTFVGRDWKRSVDENWPAFLATWKPIIQFADDQNVRVGIENCPMSFTNDEWPGGKNLATTPAIWERMFTDIPSSNFGLNYDPSHMIWQHMDYLQPMRDFSDRLFHIHAKDVRIDQQQLNRVGIMACPNEYHTPKLPGLGDVDWGRFFSVLGDTGYCGPVCVEVEDRSFEGSPGARRASLVQSHTFLRNYVTSHSAE